jgi:cytochrome b561
MKSDRAATGSTGSVEAIAFTAVLLVFTLVMLAATADLRPSASIVPRMVGVPLAALLCYRLIRELIERRQRRAASADQQAERTRAQAEISAILWLLALPAASTILGFIAGPAFHVFVWTRFRAGERTGVAIAAGAFTAAAILILFDVLLGAHLPMGMVGVLL